MANKDVEGPEHENSSESGESAEKTIEIRKKIIFPLSGGNWIWLR